MRSNRREDPAGKILRAYLPKMHPILFKIGTFELHSYGAVMVVAFIAAIWLANRRAARYGIDKSQVGVVAF